MSWVLELPALNAVLNSVAAALLICGWSAIRAGRRDAHKRLMLAALATSALFLASYVTYHLNAQSPKFPGQGWQRPAYFAMLISHVVLAAAVVPLALVTAVRGLRGRIEAHRRLARWALPIWLYVSITGVVIYVVMYVVYGAKAALRGASG